MATAFSEIDPYEVLEVTKSLTPIEIKKSYKRLCLLLHPDKLQQTQGKDDPRSADPDAFPRIQFAYSVLSDARKRQQYDQTGKLLDNDMDDDAFDWKDFFDSLYTEISVERIEEDKKIYQGSEEERRDIVSNFVFYDGDFLKLFETIPHLDFTEDEEVRVFTIIDESDVIKNQGTLSQWEKYKKSRKTKVRNMLKKLAKEAKEAAEWEKKNLGRKTIKSQDELALLIKSKQSNRFESMLDKIEAKYGGQTGKKRGQTEMDDEAFEKAQAKMLRRKKSKK